eukprot:7653113-Pyramimonas_sp.AAC.1
MHRLGGVQQWPGPLLRVSQQHGHHDCEWEGRQRASLADAEFLRPRRRRRAGIPCTESSPP